MRVATLKLGRLSTGKQGRSLLSRRTQKVAHGPWKPLIALETGGHETKARTLMKNALKLIQFEEYIEEVRRVNCVSAAPGDIHRQEIRLWEPRAHLPPLVIQRPPLSLAT